MFQKLSKFIHVYQVLNKISRVKDLRKNWHSSFKKATRRGLTRRGEKEEKKRAPRGGVPSSKLLLALASLGSDGRHRVAGPGLGLRLEVLELGRVVRVEHEAVAGRGAELGIRLKERLVAAL